MSPYNAETTGAQLVVDYASQIKGKVVLTTGVSPSGLGAFFVEAIAKASPSLLILAGRDATKVQKTADTITSTYPNVAVRVLSLDLSSLKQTRETAATVNSWTNVPHIDVLMNNAGIMACGYGTSPDGFEKQFATNHLGPFLLTNLIIEKLLKAEKGRVVNLSSDGHRLNPIRFDDYNFDGGKTYNPWRAYGQSKSANMLMALSLAEKLGKRGLEAFSLHPGVIGTNLGAKLNWNSDFDGLRAVDKEMGNKEGWGELKFKSGGGDGSGVATHIYAAFEPSLSSYNGVYLQDCHIADPWTDTVKPWATSVVEAEKLWVLSEKLVKEKFEY